MKHRRTTITHRRVPPRLWRAGPSDVAPRAGPDLSGIQLRWHDNSVSEAQFVIERRDGHAGEFQPLTTVDGNVTSYTDTTVQMGAEYQYRVSARRGELESWGSVSGFVGLAAPLVSIEADVDTCSEFKGDWGQFKLERSGGSLSRYYALEMIGLSLNGSSTATQNDWDEPSLLVLTIPAGRTELYVPVWPKADEVVELDETMILNVSATSYHHYQADPASAVLTIRERDLIDIDSDNDNAFADPAQTRYEDWMERGKPGKIVLTNHDDGDGDGIVDYADGYNWDGSATPNDDDIPPTAAQGEKFVPVILHLPAGLNPASAVYRIDYHIGAPGADPGQGKLRLWTQDGWVARNWHNFDWVDPVTSQPGDMVYPTLQGQHYTWSQLSALSWNAGPEGSQWARLYIEGINTGLTTITFEIDPTGTGQSFPLTDSVDVTVVKIDLDVNNDGDLNDAVDLAHNYLPGYEGNVPRVSSGSTFKYHSYTGQDMNLIVEGLGVGDGVARIEFELLDVTDWSGYAENAVNASTTLPGTDNDLSFYRYADDHPAVVEFTERDDHYSRALGEMVAGKTWVDFWCKDYGAWGQIRVRATIGNNTFVLREFTVPTDQDGDEIADKWERGEVLKWNAQYGPGFTYPVGTGVFGGDLDDPDPEEIDPDGATDALGFYWPGLLEMARGVPYEVGGHASYGDGRTVREEYRGYILDGGGFDWDGANAHPGGHTRLSPVYKELLVEVDATSNALDVGGFAATSVRRLVIGGWMDRVAREASKRSDGAGFRMYYVLDDLHIPRPTPDLGFVDPADLRAHLTTNRRLILSSFTHLELVHELGAWTVATGAAYPDRQAAYAVGRALAPAVRSIWSLFTDLNTFSAALISHELHHTYAYVLGDDGQGHFNDTNGNGTPNDPDDFTRVLFNYRQLPLPAGYRYQDYFQIRYGRGTTRFIDIA